MNRQQKCIYEFRTYRLDAAERLLLHEGNVVPLQPKIFDLLLVLVEHHGCLMEKDELMKLVWPDTIVEEANLINNISILRKALSENGERFIETVPKRGYRFVTDVRKAILNGAAAGEQQPTELNEISQEVAMPSGAQRLVSQIRGHKLGVGVALAAFIVVAAFWAYRMREGRNPAEPRFHPSLYRSH